MTQKEVLAVVGSRNAHEKDQHMPVSQVQTVQYLDGQTFKTIPFFQQWKEKGVTAFCWLPEAPMKVYMTTGDDLILLDLDRLKVIELKTEKLKDVHEIDIIENKLWASNTFYDELVSYQLEPWEEQSRVKLIPNQQTLNDQSTSTAEEDSSFKSKFHCNQVFSDFKGEVYSLVHHINGEQLIRKVAQKLIKSQGNGGVIRLRDGLRKRLSLKAPHSIRKIGDYYWVFDSGHSQLNVYSQDWSLVQEVEMAGWGRGGAYSEERQLYYAGVSATRKRYLQLANNKNEKNLVQVFNLELELVKQYEVYGIEQINTVYLLSASQLQAFLKLT